MTPFVCIWTNKDSAERGPTVDEQSAEVTTDFAELTTVLHVATDGPHGLWTVAVTLDAENAVSLIEKIAERYGLTVAPQVLTDELVGELGLPLNEFGNVIQSLARVLVDRGHDQDQVIHQLRDGNFHGWFDEGIWWENTGGKVVDNLEELLDLTEEEVPS